MHYSVVGSKVIRPNSDYHVSVNLHDSSTPITMRVGIKDDKNTVINSKEVTVQPYATQLTDLFTGALTSGTNYKLFALGLNTNVLNSEGMLTFNEKTFSAFIQTDMGMYKPGDLIQFRVLVLDPNMKAATIRGDMKVYITDGNSNRIKQWPNVTTVGGVFSESLKLSEYPVLGVWSINVDVMGETKTKTIEVAEYVLPTFQVTIDTPKDQVFSSGKIRATVRAKYTYGKPVKGQATVTIEQSYGGPLSQKVVPIDGKGNVEFDIKTDMKISGDYDQNFDIKAVVEEDLTGRKRNTKATVTLHQHPYVIKLINSQNQYKPGLPLTLQIQVTKHDGTPVAVTPTTNQIIVSRGPNWDAKGNTGQYYTLDSNGMVYITFVIPATENGFYMQATYLELEQNLGYFTKATSHNNQYIQAKLQTADPTINEQVSIAVTATEVMNHITYQILGRGDVLLSGTVDARGQNTALFTFMASFSMVPSAKLIVYYIKDNNIVSDKLDIDFRGELRNTINVNTSVSKAKPGDGIDITVSTQPNSFVGLLGVDQSVLLLKSGNDLSKDDVFAEFGQYDEQYFRKGFRGMGQFFCGGSPGGLWSDFNNANAILLTSITQPAPTFSPLCAFGGIAFGGVAEGAKTMAFGSSTSFMAKSAFTPTVAAAPIIRHEFPETWIWYSNENTFANSFDGQLTLHEKVPDTITSWIITGFSIDPVTGLGLTKAPTKLEVFQPFFISLNLPYSIKHGEVAQIQAVVFNYMENNVVAQVTLHNEDQEFEFVNPSNEVVLTTSIEKTRTLQVSINSNDGKSASFLIKPKKVGPLIIKVTASTPLAGDGIERILPVEPEGVPQYVNEALFIDLRSTNNVKATMSIDIQKNAVPDSTRIAISAIGDLLGITIKNLDSLIRMPYGCGEQNMLNFVPNIVIYKYLKNTNQLTDSVEGKLKKYMESGYQRELTYKHTDHSFSAFGNSDSNGSTWLTAFVCRSFNAASELMDIEQKVIDNGLNWISNLQAADGSFPERGNVIHKDMQGGSAHGMPLTAYVLIAFLENTAKIQTYRSVIDKALNYIVSNQPFLDDTYSLALVAYALQLSGHSAKDSILAKLVQKAINKGDQRNWSKAIPQTDTTNGWYERPNSVNVEMTAYAMLTELKAGHFSDALPILRWLLAQRNDQGGFQSTQDTCVGLQALAEFAERISSATSNVQVKVTYNGGEQSNINVNLDNAIVLQQYLLPPTVRSIDVSASGTGFALFSLSYQYNVIGAGEWPRFKLNPTVNANSNADNLHLTICTSYIPGDDGNVSNMAVMEIEFPSGFTADSDKIPALKSSPNVKKVETQNDNTKLILYLDKVTDSEFSVTVDAIRSHKVAEQRPVAVTIYDYYDTTKKARAFYSIPETSVCDICDDDGFVMLNI